MPGEFKSINDQLISASKSIGSGNLPFPSYGSGWGSSQIFDSHAAWDQYIDSQIDGGVNNIQKYRNLLGDLSQNSLVMAAVRFLGDALPEAPLQVKKKTGAGAGEKGQSEIVADHKLVKLWNRPNEFYSGSTLKRGIAFSLVLASNAYVLKNFNDNGSWPIELWWEPHWTCRPVWPIDGSAFISHYEVNRMGQWLTVDRANVLHIRDGIHPYNQRLGLSGNDAILRELYGDSEAANYYASLMGGSGIPGFMVSIDKEMKMDQAKLEAFEKTIVAKTTGAKKGQPLVAKGARAYKLGFNPRELDLRESRYMAEDRFCAVQGIPAVVMELGTGQAHSIYKNVQEAQERAWRNYVCPKLTMIEEELNVQLLEDFEEKDSGRYCTHNLSEVQALQEDQDKKAERLSKLYQTGVVMRSEVRSGMGYGGSDPKDEDIDKVFAVPSGTQLLKPGEVAAPQPEQSMGGGFGSEFGFDDESQFETDDNPLLDTAKAFLKGGPGSGRYPKGSGDDKEKSPSRIRNDNRIGQFHVTIIANKNQVASFQVDTIEDAIHEAHRIATERDVQGLPSLAMTAREILSKTPKGRELGEPINLKTQKKSMPSSKQLITSDDVQETIRFLRTHQFEEAAALMQAETFETKSNGYKSNGWYFKSDKEREFSSTQINFEGDVALAILEASHKIPDEDLAADGREDSPHATIKFGIHDDDPDEILELLADEKSIKVEFGPVTIFGAEETGADYDVVKIDLISPDLHRLNKKISNAVEVTDTHPNYKPHATLAYVKKGQGKKYVGMDTGLTGKEVTFDKIVFSDQSALKIEIPLGEKVQSELGA